MTPPTTSFDLAVYWQSWRSAVDAELDRLAAAREPAGLWNSVRYSLQAGGKRLRPILTIATLEALGHDPRPALSAACAVEFIHTQSLIHDDLPAMDDDDLRRGKPTNHKVFGEAAAILAGDGLLGLAFIVLAAELTPRYDAALCLRAVRVLGEATVYGMVSGQVVDIESEGKPVNIETLEYIHRHKTGALIRAAVRMGALFGGADVTQAAALDTYADAVGLAFQIADDILDGTKTAAELGKTPGKDVTSGKATYVALYGAAHAHVLLDGARNDALNALAGWGPEAEPLRAIARYVASQVA